MSKRAPGPASGKKGRRPSETSPGPGWVPLKVWLNRAAPATTVSAGRAVHPGRRASGDPAMEMHQVRYFLAVAETLNFTRAAERCNVSQPALTRAIKKLEEEFGGQLFRRERNLTHLTDLGRLMKPRLEKILMEARSVTSAARQFHSLEQATLNLGVMCTIGPRRLINLFAQVQRELPGLDVHLLEATPDVLIERMMAGDLDIAFLAQPAELPERFDRRPLYRERFVVAFPPGHRFERVNQFVLYDIGAEPYLSRKSCEFAQHFRALLSERGITLNYRYRTEREDWIQSMILAGLGCAFMPEYLPIYPELPTRVIAEPEVTRTVELVSVAGRRFSPVVLAFIQMVMDYEWTSVTS